MTTSLKFEGIYDFKTFNCLKSLSIKNFGFDFSPKSLNFLQTKTFLNEIMPKLEEGDFVFLKFDHVFDPMIEMLLTELKTSRVKKENIILEFNFFDKSFYAQKFSQYKFIFSYFDLYFNQIKGLEALSGITLEHARLVELDEKGILINFITNFHSKVSVELREKNLLEVKMDWTHHIPESFFDLIDVSHLSYKIDSNVEVCYRNVDLAKIEKEIENFNKLNLAGQCADRVIK